MCWAFPCAYFDQTELKNDGPSQNLVITSQKVDTREAGGQLSLVIKKKY